jgi:hypothetical protein
VQKVFIDGTRYFDRDTEVSGRPGKATEKQRLIEKEKQNAQDAQKKGAPTRRPQ